MTVEEERGETDRDLSETGWVVTPTVLIISVPMGL